MRISFDKAVEYAEAYGIPINEVYAQAKESRTKEELRQNLEMSKLISEYDKCVAFGYAGY